MATSLSKLTDAELDQFVAMLESGDLPDDAVDELAQNMGMPAAGSLSSLTPEEWSDKMAAEASLAEFIRQAWHVVEPDVEFIDGWHIDAIAAHLEATLNRNGPINNLLMNIPPGCMKSLATSVFFPSWAWIHNPSLRFLCTSYEQSLSTRDSMRCRQIIQSDWYRRRWGDRFKLTGDQNEKTKFENDKRGWRIATSVGGRGTGEHPDVVICDDPHKVKEAESETERQAAIRYWDGTISSRGKVRGVRRIVIMQRLHEDDLSGHILENDAEKRWVHICLPMRAEPDRMDPTPLGWTDPREPGELLWEGAFGEGAVSELETDLGTLRAAGQLQQRPAPMGGELFHLDWFEIVDASPVNARRVRYWDKACVLGSTLVDTSRGPVRIDEIIVGDFVRTRFGFYPVKWAGITKYVDRLTVAEFPSGVVAGTGDHLFWTYNRGWVQMGQLTGTDQCHGGRQIPIRSFLMVGVTRENPAVDIIIATNGTRSQNGIGTGHCIETFGNRQTAPFRTDSTSTMSMAIGTTTRSTICKRYRRPIIAQNMRTKCGNRTLSKRYGSRRLPPPPAAAGLFANARNAGPIIRPVAQPQNFAVRDVRQIAEIAGFANNVPVYDLTVDGPPEFFANGVLVHNSTEGGGAYSAGVRMSLATETGVFYVEHVERRQVSPHKRNLMIKATATMDADEFANTVEQWLESEGGSGGKESGEISVKQLRGFPVYLDRPTGDKVARSLPFAAQCEAGNVKIVRGSWNRDYLDELTSFPTGKYKDQVDGSSGAFNKLAAGGVTMPIDEILASGDPEHLAEERTPFSDDEVDELPEFMRDLITETRALADERRRTRDND